MTTVNIVKWGNSQGIRLPRYLLESVDMAANDEVEITAKDGRIIIEKSAKGKHKTLKERLASYNGDYAFEEFGTGVPVGMERFWEEESDGI